MQSPQRAEIPMPTGTLMRLLKRVLADLRPTCCGRPMVRAVDGGAAGEIVRACTSCGKTQKETGG
jgi:hypothetical protein